MGKNTSAFLMISSSMHACTGVTRWLSISLLNIQRNIKINEDWKKIFGRIKIIILDVIEIYIFILILYTIY